MILTWVESDKNSSIVTTATAYAVCSECIYNYIGIALNHNSKLQKVTRRQSDRRSQYQSQPNYAVLATKAKKRPCSCAQWMMSAHFSGRCNLRVCLQSLRPHVIHRNAAAVVVEINWWICRVSLWSRRRSPIPILRDVVLSWTTRVDLADGAWQESLISGLTLDQAALRQTLRRRKLE